MIHTSKISIENISIQTGFNFNIDDIEFIILLHEDIYKKEYGYGIEFKKYVEEDLKEFVRKYEPERNRLWICRHNESKIGCILLEDRGESAQLRFFLIKPDYRGIRLGKKLMDLFMEFLRECGYSSAYLWTTHELESAAALYKKYGFVLTEEKPSVRFGKQLTEHRYDLVL